MNADISTTISKPGQITADITITGRAFKAADRAARTAHSVGLAELPIETAAAVLTGHTDAVAPNIVTMLDKMNTAAAAELTVRVQTVRQMLTGGEATVLRWRR